MPRFLMLVKGDPKPGQLPSEEMLAAMGKYNDELAKAGVLLDLSGLHPSSEGVRVQFSGGKRTVTDGPFAEAKELIAGFAIIEVNSKDEAIEWATRFANVIGDVEIEIRQVVELSDFPPENVAPEAAAREQALREELQRKAAKP